MQYGKPSGPATRLAVEHLEDRTVPTSFGANRGMSVALADVIPNFGGNEYVTGTGPGTPALVRVWDLNGKLLTSFKPFGDSFLGGVNLATGNVDGDNQTELIVSTAAGTTGKVKVYKNGIGGFQQVAAFLPFGPNYDGGVECAVANVTGDRPQEIVCGQQSKGSLVKVFADINADSTLQFSSIRKFFPFGSAYLGGVSVAAANVDATRNNMPTDPYDYNYAEVLVGKASDEPRIKIFDVQTPTVTLRGSLMAADTSLAINRNGVNLAAGSTDGRRGAEIYVAIKGSSRIRFFSGNGAFLGEVFPFITTTSRMTNMAIGQNDDDFFDVYNPADLIVVRGDGPYSQVPLVYPGKTNSPAGLNGSFPA